MSNEPEITNVTFDSLLFELAKEYKKTSSWYLTSRNYRRWWSGRHHEVLVPAELDRH
jgi:hypothetical protein